MMSCFRTSLDQVKLTLNFSKSQAKIVVGAICKMKFLLFQVLTNFYYTTFF